MTASATWQLEFRITCLFVDRDHRPKGNCVMSAAATA